MDDHNRKGCAPEGRTHHPVLTVDYQKIDADAGYGDALFMDIGKSTWNKEDFSAKIWRRTYNQGRWSRQSEELPLSRALDLAILISSVATEKSSSLQYFYQREKEKENLRDFLMENMLTFGPKFDELRRILQSESPAMENAEIPNIFSFATSELSQDAMFAWLLSWADPQYRQYDANLHRVALDCVRVLTGMTDLEAREVMSRCENLRY